MLVESSDMLRTSSLTLPPWTLFGALSRLSQQQSQAGYAKHTPWKRNHLKDHCWVCTVRLSQQYGCRVLWGEARAALYHTQLLLATTAQGAAGPGSGAVCLRAKHCPALRSEGKSVRNSHRNSRCGAGVPLQPMWDQQGTDYSWPPPRSLPYTAGGARWRSRELRTEVDARKENREKTESVLIFDFVSFLCVFFFTLCLLKRKNKVN